MVDPREILKLKSLIENDQKFFNYCGVHTKSFMNTYCMDCDGEPLCAMCSSDEIESRHRAQGHKVLQVQKTTRMNGIKEEDIDKYLRFDIFKLKNNGSEVFAIITKGNSKGKVHTCDQHYCIHCNFVFKTSERSPPQPNARYCSLQCKVEAVENSLAISPASSSVTAAASDCSKTLTITTASDNETLPCHNLACFVEGSYRKRPRKAKHPCRAPFS